MFSALKLKNCFIKDYSLSLSRWMMNQHNLPLGHGPPRLADELLSVQSDLHPVVEEGEQGGQGEGRHEDCDETELEHWNTEMVLRIVTHYHNMTLTTMTSTYDYI